MTDLREGRIQAFLESEMAPEGRREFIAEMATDQALADAVEAQRARIQTVSSALDAAFRAGPTSVHQNPDDVREAWTSVAERVGVTNPDFSFGAAPSRLSTAAPPRGRRPGWRATLGPVIKAASLLLVAAGAVTAAIPDSPLRLWAAEHLFGGGAPSTAAVEEAATGASAGLRVPIFSGTMRIVLSEPLLSESLSIRLVDGDVLEVLGGPGTRFFTSESHVEVAAANGPVTIRIPRSQNQAVVEVAGVVYLRKLGDRVDVLQAGADSLPSEFIFSPREE